MRLQRRKFSLETLETRRLLYATMTGLSAGNVFPHPEKITYSIVPDGTTVGSVTSDLRASLSGLANFETQVDTAFAIWGSVLGVNFVKVGDDGAALGSDLVTQGSASRGDIRIAGYGMGASYGPGYAWNPPQLLQTSLSSDIFLNTQAVWGGTGYNLITVMQHEIGHAIGLEHSTSTSAVMYPTLPTSNTLKTLSSDDVDGGRSLFPLSFDGYGVPSSTPIPLVLDSNNVARPSLPTKLLGGYSQLFSVNVPGYGRELSTNAVVTVSSAGLSNLTPVVSVFDASNNLITTAQSSSLTGDTVTINLPYSQLSSTLKFVVAGRVSHAIAGSYSISVAFGQSRPDSTQPTLPGPPTAPSYGLMGYWGWGQTNPAPHRTITYSFVPDGSMYAGGVTSTLGAYMSGIDFTTGVYTGYGASSYKDIVRLAFQTWSLYAGLNFVEVADNGAYSGSGSYTQNNPDFGDIRIGGAVGLGSGVIAAAYSAPAFGSSNPTTGDIFVSTDQSFPGLNYLQSFIHEIGHAIGLDHSTNTGSVMYPTASSVFTPDAADIAMLTQAYPWPAGPNNHTSGTALPLSPTSNYTRYTGLSLTNDSTGSTEDWYWVHPPTTANNTMTVTVQASNLGLLDPDVTFYYPSLTPIGTVSSPRAGGNSVAVIRGVSNSASLSNGYFIKVSRPLAGVGVGSNFVYTGALGAYSMTIDFGTVAPNTYSVGTGVMPTSPFRNAEVEDPDTTTADAVNAELIALAISLLDDED